MIKNKSISFRVTGEEYERIKTLARHNNKSISDYIVHQSLQENRCHNTDLSIIPEIRYLLSKLEHKIIRKEKYIKEMRRLLNAE